MNKQALNTNSLEKIIYGKPKKLVYQPGQPLPIKTNYLLFAVVTLVNLFSFLIAPILIKHNIYYCLTLIPCLLLVPTTGIIVHESIHNLMHSSLNINRMMGRIMAVFVGVAYDLQRLDHLRHHVYNRTIKNCDEYYNPQAKKPIKAYISYYYGNFIGVYWNDFLLTVALCHLPVNLIFRCMSFIYAKQVNHTIDCAITNVIKTNKLRAVREEGIFLAILLTLSIYLYWPHIWIFLVYYILRAQILAVLDSFAHYDTPLNDVLFAKNVKLPKLIEKYIFMNFNNHGVHHVFPSTSWLYLPRCKEYFAPNFYFINHGGLWKAIKKKYSLPYPLKEFPTEKVVYNFRKSVNK